jgi:hypothetical protein
VANEDSGQLTRPAPPIDEGESVAFFHSVRLTHRIDLARPQRANHRRHVIKTLQADPAQIGLDKNAGCDTRAFGVAAGCAQQALDQLAQNRRLDRSRRSLSDSPFNRWFHSQSHVITTSAIMIRKAKQQMKRFRRSVTRFIRAATLRSRGCNTLSLPAST